MLPLALSDDQLDTVMRGAAPLPPQDRHKYLQRVAELLYQQGEIGDGAVARACREAQRAFFRPADRHRSPRSGEQIRLAHPCRNARSAAASSAPSSPRGNRWP